MRTALFLIFLAGCSFPELAMAPDERPGPAPRLSPLGPLLADPIEADAEADADLEARAAEMRRRAAALPDDPIEPATREAMEAIGRP